MRGEPDTSTAKFFTVMTAFATLLFLVLEFFSSPHAAVEVFIVVPLLVLAWGKVIRLWQAASADGAEKPVSNASLTLGRSLLLLFQIGVVAMFAWIFGSALGLF